MASEVVEREQKWIIPNLIPDETLTLVIGEPGAGKSTLCLAVAKWWFSCNGRKMIMESNEDSQSDIRKRFRLMGGDLTSLYLEDVEEGVWTIDNCSALEESLKQISPSIVIIDSLFSHSPGKAKVNMRLHEEVAPVLVQLRKLATKYQCAILLIHHTNKSNSTDPLQKSASSQGIIATARHAVMVAKHPDGEQGLRAVVNIKSNIGPVNAGGRLFSIEPAFQWREDTELTGEDLLKSAQDEKQQDENRHSPGKIEQAAGFLREFLRDGNPKWSQDVATAAANVYEINPRTLQRAASRIGVVQTREHNTGKFLWRLSTTIH